MRNKKIFNNKTAKGLASLIAIVILLSLILATSIIYQNNITANVVKETSINDNEISIKITIVNDINELNQLNEGWYEINNGYVYYLDTFNSYVPLYIKVKNLEEQNSILGVEEDGTLIFYKDFGLGKEEVENAEKRIQNKESTQNQIAGAVTDLESVSGLATVTVGPGAVIGKIPSAQTPTKKQEYVVDLGGGRYKVIVTDPQTNGQTVLRVYDVTAKTEGGKTTYTYDDQQQDAKTYTISNPEALSGMLLQNWNGDIKNVPIQNGVRDASQCSSGSTTCTYTDTFKDQSKVKTTISESRREVERSRTAYFYQGREISKQEFDNLNTQEQQNAQQKEVRTYREAQEIENGKVKYVTSYRYGIRFDENKNPITTYEAVTIDKKTGRVERFTYGEIDLSTGKEQKVAFDKDGKLILTESGYGDPSFLEKAEKARTQHRYRQWFAEIERILTEFQGLGYYSTLFFSDDELLKWRDSVDQIFATLYLGTEYWSSEICGQYLDGESEGVAYAETPQGLAQVGAHIEATRTQEIKTNNATVFIYKITFAVRNGDFENDPRAPEEMNINVLIKGQQTVKLFKKDQKVKRGSIFGKTGRNAIVQESSNLFNQVCITFDQIPLRWKLDNKELCNKIQESTGTPTTIEVPPKPGTPGRLEDDINDF